MVFQILLPDDPWMIVASRLQPSDQYLSYIATMPARLPPLDQG